MLPCGSNRGRKGQVKWDARDSNPQLMDKPHTLCLTCPSPVLSAGRCPFGYMCLWCVLFLRVKLLHDDRSTGTYQVIERAAALPCCFVPEFSSWPPSSSVSEGRATVQQNLALYTSSIHQMRKSACNKKKYFLTQIQAFYKPQASFQL